MAVNQTTNANAQEAAPVSKNLRDIIRATQRSAGRANSGLVNKAISVMKSDIADASGDILEHAQVLPFIGTNLGLNLSGIIVHIAVDQTCYYHVIAVAEACEVLPRTMQLGQNNIEVTTTVSDLANDDVFTIAQEELERLYKGKVTINEFYDSNVSVLHDLEYTSDVLRYASDTLYDLIDTVTDSGNPVFDSADAVRGLSPRATVTYNGQPELNSEMLPTRNDISVAVTGQVARGPGEDPQVLPLSTVSGFINLNYVTPQIQHTPQGSYTPTKQYQPEFIATSSKCSFNANSLELLMFNIYAQTACLTGNNWLNVFRPVSFAAGENNWRDIGAVNYDVPAVGDDAIDGKKINTSTTEFAQTGLYALADRYIHNDMGFALDIDESGNQSWLTNALTRLVPTDGTPASIEAATVAKHAIVDAMNKLTNNSFGQFFEGGNIILPQLERIHTGTYRDAEGTLRDIREIDYLALLNIQGGTPDGMLTVYDYMATFEDLTDHEEVRLRKRWDILRKILGDTVKHTGWAIRVRFTTEFLTAVVAAIKSQNLGIAIDGITTIDAAPERGYNHQGYGINSSVTGNAFQQNTANYGHQQASRNRNWT